MNEQKIYVLVITHRFIAWEDTTQTTIEYVGFDYKEAREAYQRTDYDVVYAEIQIWINGRLEERIQL